MNYKVSLAKNPDGWYTVECLNFPGCISQGRTKKDALKNIKDAIKGYLASLKKHPDELVYREVKEVVAVSV